MCLEGQPAVLLARSRAWDRRTNNRERVDFFRKRSFNVVNFQRPDWICGSFYTTFKHTRLVEIAHINDRGEFFSLCPTGLE